MELVVVGVACAKYMKCELTSKWQCMLLGNV